MYNDVLSNSVQSLQDTINFRAGRDPGVSKAKSPHTANHLKNIWETRIKIYIFFAFKQQNMKKRLPVRQNTIYAVYPHSLNERCTTQLYQKTPLGTYP